MDGLEIELKFLLRISPQVFLEKFNSFGIRTYQKTVMFDNEQSLMKSTNGRLRLRQTGEEVSLSYKLPITSDVVKREIEWETKIDNWKVGEELLKAIGFKETTSYEKYRTSFNYRGVKIEVDEYPFANFVELEGDEKLVKKIALSLGFNLSNALTKPCDTLFTEWRINRGLPIKLHMTFSDYDQ
jgi:adenylate cyclase class 2